MSKKREGRRRKGGKSTGSTAPRPTTMVVGVAWYAESEWAAVKATATDADKFENSFPEWLEMVEAAIARFRAAGLTIKKVLVSATEFRAWCEARGKSNDSGSRAEYAAERVRQEASDGD